MEHRITTIKDLVNVASIGEGGNLVNLMQDLCNFLSLAKNTELSQYVSSDVFVWIDDGKTDMHLLCPSEPNEGETYIEIYKGSNKTIIKTKDNAYKVRKV